MIIQKNISVISVCIDLLLCHAWLHTDVAASAPAPAAVANKNAGGHDDRLTVSRDRDRRLGLVPSRLHRCLLLLCKVGSDDQFHGEYMRSVATHCMSIVIPTYNVHTASRLFPV